MLARAWRIDAAYQLLNLQAVDAEISQIARLAESTRLPLARWHLLRQQASRAALAGQLAIARDRSEEARRLAIRLQDPSGAGLSYSFAVWLAFLRGDPAEIPADFFDVTAAAPPIPVVRAGLAMGLFTSGRADELARQAAVEARRLDMPGPADRADRLARQLERAMAAANPLTRREQEIAGLISDGLTNRAITDRLVLSKRTVEGHVRSTLAKLQLTNRTELAAWALRDTGS